MKQDRSYGGYEEPRIGEKEKLNQQQQFASGFGAMSSNGDGDKVGHLQDQISSLKAIIEEKEEVIRQMGQ